MGEPFTYLNLAHVWEFVWDLDDGHLWQNVVVPEL